jgi:hypothetical protein
MNGRDILGRSLYHTESLSERKPFSGYFGRCKRPPGVRGRIRWNPALESSVGRS